MVDVPVFTEDEVVGVEEIFDIEEPQHRAPFQSPEQQSLTANLAAVAQKDHEPNTTFDDLVARNEETIAIGEEVFLRNEAKLRQQKARKQAIDELAFDSLIQGNQEEAEVFLDLETEQDLSGQAINDVIGYNALEEQAVTALQNDEMLGNPEYGAAQQGLFGEDLGSTIDVLRDETTKSLIFQRRLDQYREELKERGAIGFTPQAREFAGMFLLPFYEQQGRLNVRTNEDFDRQGFQNVRPGAAIRRQIEGLWAMPLPEFETELENIFTTAEEQSGVFGVNETLALEILEQYERGTITGTNVVFTDVVTALDSTIILAPLAKVFAGGVKGVSSVAKLSGARNTAAVIDTKSIIASKRAVGEAATESTEATIDAVDHMIPRALKPTDLLDETSIEISGTTSEKLAEIERLADELGDITTQGRLSDEQLQPLVDKKIAALRERDANISVEDYRVQTDPVTKITSVETFVGRKAGGGFATESAAKGAATRRGFASFDVVEENGHHFIKVTDVVEELTANGIPLARRADNSAEVIPESGPITAGIKARDLLLPPDLAVRSQEAQLANVAFRERIINPLSKEITKIGRKRLEALNAVMTIGRNEKRWFPVDEFALKWAKVTGADPTEQDFIAYAAAKQISDIDYTIHNNHLYTNLARRGAVTANIQNKTSGFDFSNLTVFRLNLTPEQATSVRLFDVEDNIVRTGKADTPPQELDDLAGKLESGDYELLRLKESVTFEGDPVHIILAPKSSATIKPLARQVLNYTAGGHLFRRTKWFAKQANKGTYKDGTEFVLGPRTLATYRTEGIARAHVDDVNNALRMYRDYIGGRTAAGSVQNARALVDVRKALAESPFESLDNLERMIAQGRIDPFEDFEAVFDRGVPSFYDNISSAADNLFTEDDPLDGTLQWLNSTGRDYYGKRTDGLLSPHEEADVVLDPLLSLSKGIEHASRTHAYDHFINRSVEEWTRVASPFIDSNSLGGISDARHMFYNGEFLQNARINNPNLVSKLEENRVLIKRQMGLKTPSQERFEAAKRNVARFVEAKGGTMGTKLVQKIDDINANNPINALNSLIFDSWLGLFDLSQMFVQTQTIATAVAASPKYGASALINFLPMRWLSVSKSANLPDYLANTLSKVNGQNPADFKQMITQYQKSGWNNPGGEIAYLANHANSVGSAGIVHKIQQGRRAGRVFFNEAERWNRMVAWNIAWRETSDLLPKLARDSDEFLATVNKRTNDFSISMTSASNSKIQQGIFSPATRFLGYQMRLLEAILPKQFGGNPAFSGPAKARILASQIFLYGSKGLPFGQRISDVAQDLYSQVTGDDLAFAQQRAVESGAIDSVLYAISGGDLNTDFAERAGFGRGLDFTFEKMGDGSMGSAMAVMAGPAYSFSSRYAESVNKVFLYFRGTRGPLDLDAKDAEFVLNELLVKHVNSLRRAQKAMTIWRLGQVIDPRTGRPMFDATALEGGAAFIGVPLYEETERRKLQDKLVDTQDEVREVGNLIVSLDREAFRLMAEGNFKEADIIMRQNALIIASYDNDPLLKSQIAQFATRQLGYSGTDWQQLLERVQQRLGSDEVPNIPPSRSEED